MADQFILDALYSSMNVVSYTDSNGIKTSTQSTITKFLKNPIEANYIDMVNAINTWFSIINANGFGASILPGTNATIGLRLLLSSDDGSVYYDSAAGINNLFSNFKKPRLDFATSGKFMINENHSSRPYIMGPLLTNVGKYTMTKFSTTVNRNVLYYAVRQGNSISEPHGVVVISMNA